VTVSSPILALNLLLRHPIPFPRGGMFDAPRDPHPIARPSYVPPSISDSHTQVNADDNLKRLLGVLGRAPKLSLLPSNDMKTPQTPQPSAHTDTDTEYDRAGAGDGDGPQEVQAPPPPRRARHQHRHSSHHHPTRYSQSYGNAYERARRQTKSLSVSFPTCDPRQDLF
jgi:hypothetical protein